ncbi:hypothetical protein K3722_15315 [Leisingera caerulea]|uniref:Restriction endonuclease n=1 Tax=Leisingera caerulea TaxID=506591 RepID=A0ABY5WU45_LEICA|nr:hypothetical protein [Leisingera caerulea]UWQ57845.1 hypothetical protein K3722_15315 [Leisingera caerulea]
MRQIEISTDVFALIWAAREAGEETEDQILRRLLLESRVAAKPLVSLSTGKANGLVDFKFGVTFQEGFEIFRCYLGNEYRAVVSQGAWRLDGNTSSFSTLNELSRAIGTKTENAWMNWFFIDQDGRKQPVGNLRDSKTVQKRTTIKKGEERVGRVRWCDDVREALTQLGGKAHLEKIYAKVREIRSGAGRSTPETLKEVVRKELEIRSPDSKAFLGQDWFRIAGHKGEGYWALTAQ